MTTTPIDTWVDAGWMQTYTGRRFYVQAPDPMDVVIEDIAHALSLICRYGGHVDRFYSVAEHCIHLSHVVPRHLALWALLHDATEAYVGDMIRPLKLAMSNYRALEDNLMLVIAHRFALATKGLGKGHLPAEVKEADNRILLDERAALMTATRHRWDVDELEPLGVTIHGWEPTEAERLYLERFDALTGAGGPS